MPSMPQPPNTLDIPALLHEAQDILDRHQLVPEQQAAVREQLNRIRRRHADTDLYLAVIGEFNSGKSTLIDALLDDPLLESGAVPTTAAATYIHSGRALDALVRFRDQEPLLVSRDWGRILGSLAALDPATRQAPPADLRALLTLITTRPAIAAQVVRCDISHPASFLANGIVVVDTPGVSSTNEAHAAATERVVEQEADLVVVAIPIFWQISLTFETFLRETLQPFLRRAVFIVTKADSIDEPEERRRALAHIRTQIQKRLGVESPELYVVAARAALQRASGQPNGTEDALQWADAFTHVKSLLAARMHAERPAIIAEQLIRLLDDLIARLNSGLEQQTEVYNAREMAIRRDALPDYEAFFAGEQRAALASIEAFFVAAGKQVEQFVAQSRQRLNEAIRAQVYAAPDAEGLRRIISTNVGAAFDAETAQLAQSVTAALATASAAGTQVEDVFDQRFAISFAALQKLSNAPTTVSAPVIPPAVSVGGLAALKDAKGVLEKSSARHTRATVGGAAAGAAVGTLIAPGLGTLVGAGLGALAGQVFRPSLDDQKAKVWAAIQTQLGSQMEAIREACLHDVEASYLQATQHAAATIASRAQQYAELYRGLRAQQQAAWNQLEAARAMLPRDRAALTQRQQALRAYSAQLAQLAQVAPGTG